MPKQKDSKRIKHGSGRTLDHFFCKKPEPASTQPPPRFLKKRDSSSGSRNLALKPWHTNGSSSSNSEIIVIDSDDEIEVSLAPTRAQKRRLSEDSDIEFVDAVSFPLKRAPVDGPAVLESQALNSSLFASSSSTSSTFTFGKPYLLSDASTMNTPSHPSFAFGTVGNLLDPLKPGDTSTSINSLKTTSKKEIPEHSDLDAFKKDETYIDQDLSEDLTGDWSMGDDEIGNRGKKEGVSDDDELEFVEEVLAHECEETFSHTVNPRCEKELDTQQSLPEQGGQTQARINYCLESSKVGNSHRPSSDSKTPSINFKTPSTGKLNTKCSTGNDVFSVLMSSFKENEAWKEATAVEDKSFKPAKSNGGRRKAPFYKILQGMPISVDAFRYSAIPGVTAYFLSHAHSDHYTNLSSCWKSGPIYCSQATANLIIHVLSVDKKWVRPLPMDTPTIIPDTNGVQVTLIEANHCPGSCLFLFEGRQTVNAGDSTFRSPYVGSSTIFRYLHCGDFRASPRHVMHPAVRDKKIDHVYLDTTYLDPKYTFPAQPLVISACAELSRRLLNGEPTTSNSIMKSWLPSLPSLSSSSSTVKGKTLVVIGTYSIGKERIVKAVAHALGSKVYCDSRKVAILRCEGDEELEAMLTSNPLAATVHLVPLGTIATDRLKIYMDRFKGAFTKVIGFRPTGWTYSQPAGTDLMPTVTAILTRTVQRDFTYADLHQSPKSSPTIQVYGVPYSEHSSFYELTCFAMSLNWTKMIATVNVGSESSRGKMSKWVGQWEVEKKKRGVNFVVTPRHEDYW